LTPVLNCRITMVKISSDSIFKNSSGNNST
jgi:hypothetical protein